MGQPGTTHLKVKSDDVEMIEKCYVVNNSQMTVDLLIGKKNQNEMIINRDDMKFQSSNASVRRSPFGNKFLRNYEKKMEVEQIDVPAKV